MNEKERKNPQHRQFFFSGMRLQEEGETEEKETTVAGELNSQN